MTSLIHLSALGLCLPHQVLRDLEREGNPLASQVREVMFNRTAID